MGGKKQRGKNRPGVGGGYREGSGRSKSGRYRGIFCGSTYELIFLVFHLEHKIPIIRCRIVLSYVYGSRTRSYHPDFEVGGRMVEVKGYMNEQAKAKHDQNPEVVLVGRSEIEFMKQATSLKGKTLAQLISTYDKKMLTRKTEQRYSDFAMAFHRANTGLTPAGQPTTQGNTM